ncbi:BTB/POZ domain-containing protein [Xylaria arbuscula]|nr:BTB/POZ domain-containing protein [Xylaria arbuscula]
MPRKGLFSEGQSTKALEPGMTNSNRSVLIEGISKLFNNPDHSDVKVYIGSHELAAHSVVLVTQSPFFQKALSENFREGKDKQFHFEEGSPHAHWRVFEYLYTGDYTEEPIQVLCTQDDDELLKDVRVYVTADFFMLDDLKQQALERFKSKLDILWVSELFVDCIREVYASTTPSDNGLRGAVVKTAQRHLVELWKRKAYRDLLSEGGDFVVDLMGTLCGS